ncbi:hypothetical protein H0H87_011421, partial [Tephrocybe sp. NHM501043]
SAKPCTPLAHAFMHVPLYTGAPHAPPPHMHDADVLAIAPTPTAAAPPLLALALVPALIACIPHPAAAAAHPCMPWLCQGVHLSLLLLYVLCLMSA